MAEDGLRMREGQPEIGLELPSRLGMLSYGSRGGVPLGTVLEPLGEKPRS